MVETAIKNPYWDIVKTIPGYEGKCHPDWVHSEHDRNTLCGEYAWAIPDPDSLQFVAEHLTPKAVEIGAGTGYWASLLAQMGVNMLCYDIDPPQHTGQNHYHSPRNENCTKLLGITREVFFDVRSGNHLIAREHPDRTLLLCWPPYDNDMAYHTLSAYQGQRLVYIGESAGGCTGDDQFFELLAEQWHLVAEHTPVQWWGIHDVIEVYERGHAEREA